MKRSPLRAPRTHVRGRPLYLLAAVFVLALVAVPAVADLSDDVLNSPPPPGITPVGPPEGDEAGQSREPVQILSRAELEATGRELERGRAEKKAHRESSEGKAERKRSKRAHKEARKADSVSLLRREFPGLRELRGKPLVLPPGGRVREYVGDNAARIEDANGETTLAVSEVPLRVPSEGGDDRRPLDLTLAERAGGFEPASPMVPLHFDEALDEGFALGRDWIRVFFEAGSAAVAGSKGSVVDQKAYYHEAATDTDFMVTPLPKGFESFTQLRSVESPEVHSLRFQLPAGASLRAIPDGGAQIVEGEKELVRIARPTAVDAQEQAIPASYVIEGDLLKIVVRHRELDAAYPILVDPVVEISPGFAAVTEDWITAPGGAWVHNPGLDRKGWDFQSYLPGGQPDWFYVWNGWFYFCTPVLCNGSPNGLSIVSRNNAPYPAWSFGQWLFKTKGDVYIPRVDYAHVSKAWAGNDDPNDYWSYVATGIHSNSLGRQTASYAHYGPNVPNHSTIANSSDWTHGSTAHFSLIYQLPHPAGYTVAYLGGAIVYLMDRSNPQVTAVSDLPSHWLPGGVTGEVTAIANDAGLGVNGFGLKIPGHADQARIDFTCGDRNRPCPNQRSNIDVGGAPFTYNTSQMPDGANTIEIAAMDALWKLSPSVTRTVKVDKSGPQIALSGALLDESSSGVLRSGGARGLRVEAADPLSGAKSVTVRLNGIDLRSEANDCVEGGCIMRFDMQFDPATVPAGRHTLEIAARDQVDNRSTRTITIDVRDPEAAIVVRAASEPEDYQWTPELPLGLHVQKSLAGNLVAENALGQTVASLGTPTATDSGNKAVPVTFDVSGGIVTLRVTHRALEAEYPVLIDTNDNAVNPNVLNTMIDQLMSDVDNNPPPANAAYEIEDVVIDDGDLVPTAESAANDDSRARLHGKELDWCIDHPNSCRLFLMDRRKAYRLTEHLYGERADYTKINAFQHSFWVALMTESMWEKYGDGALRWADEFATVHEYYTLRSASSFTRLGSRMDIHNNGIGHLFAAGQAAAHNDEFMCNAMKNKQREGIYTKDEDLWDLRLVWIKKRERGLIQGRDCGPA